MLANLTLRRFQELLERSTGGGTAVKDQEMPPVARANLNQIYLPRHPEDTIGLRNLRELRTLTTLVDMIAQNDLLRALDVAVQRIKSIELFVAQGQWGQANLMGADRARGRAAGMVPSRIEGGSAGAEERSATAAGSVAAEAPGLGTKSRSRRRRREKGRRDKRRHTTLEWGEPRKGEERKRQRQEGPREVVNEDAAANELGYRAMKESQIHAST